MKVPFKYSAKLLNTAFLKIIDNLKARKSLYGLHHLYY